MRGTKVIRVSFVVPWVAGLLSAFAQPVITTQPTNQAAIVGETVSYVVEATGTVPLLYQWRFYSTGLTFTNIVEATNSTLTLTNVQRTPGRFRVVVSNSEGSVTSALLRLDVLLPPDMSQEPPNQTLEMGQTLRITATATNNVTVPMFRPPHHQWYFNGNPLEGKSNSLLIITNFQLSNLGTYFVIATNVAGSVTSRVATMFLATTAFTRITNGPIATSRDGDYRACAWGDYDNDGDPDLIIVDYDWHRTNRLYRNDGAGVFTQMAGSDVGSLVTHEAFWTGAFWGDYDNDGALDLYASTTFTSTTNGLYRNDGTGRFVLMTNSGALATNTVPAENAPWADYDRDGFLDLIFSGGNRLFHNEGNGQFTQRPPLLPGNGFFATWFDSDNDLDPDLTIYSLGTNHYFRNDNGVDFVRVTNLAITSFQAVPVPADYDNDGFTDPFLDGTLYRNVGSNQWFAAATLGNSFMRFFAPAWGDYDNDGDLDLFAGAFGGPDLFFANNGDGTFSQLSQIAPALMPTNTQESAAAAWADYDNDGFLDLYVAQFGGFYSGLLYHNEGNTNHWLMLKLTGTVANRSAIGAKVHLLAAIGGRTYWQMREIFCGGVGQNDLRVHFGLGDATQAQALRIEWPSGQVSNLRSVAANQILSVTEPPALSAPRAVNGEVALHLRAHVGMTCDLYVSSNLIDWAFWQSVGQTNRTITVSDPDFAVSHHRFFKASAR